MRALSFWDQLYFNYLPMIIELLTANPTSRFQSSSPSEGCVIPPAHRTLASRSLPASASLPRRSLLSKLFIDSRKDFSGGGDQGQHVQ